MQEEVDRLTELAATEKLATGLMARLFTKGQLAYGNCTDTKGRWNVLDRDILAGIQRKCITGLTAYMYVCLSLHLQINDVCAFCSVPLQYTFDKVPHACGRHVRFCGQFVPPPSVERWNKLAVGPMNFKCRNIPCISFVTMVILMLSYNPRGQSNAQR